MRAIIALVALATAVPALAVGMAPLAKQGNTAGTAKAFYLTVINPYATARTFRAYAEGAGPEAGVGNGGVRVSVVPARLTIKPGGQRRIAVVLAGLTPGETREVRICAELAQQEGMIHARVCSRLSATRLAARPRPDA